ncbi:MAG: BrnA antitoxin family protein [Pseudomonadota bacterium]
MAQKENIMNYSAKEIKQLRTKGKSKTDWRKIDSMTDKEIKNAIAHDIDSAPDPFNWDKVIVEVTPPKSPLYMRLDADVLNWFKGQGKGYQGTINAVLRSYVNAQQHK